MPEVLSWYDYMNLALNHLSSYSKTNQMGPLSAPSLYNSIESQVLCMSGMGTLTNKRSPGSEALSSGSEAVFVWTPCVCLCVSPDEGLGDCVLQKLFFTSPWGWLLQSLGERLSTEASMQMLL